METTAPRPAGSRTRILAIILLPFLLAGLAGWEVVRGTATLTATGRDAAGLSGQIGRVEALARRDPQAMVQFTGDSQSFAAPVAARMMRDGAGRLETDLLVARVRLPFAWLATGAALLSLIGGLLALLLVELAARRSRRSREALVRAFGQMRQLLPFALGCQVTGVALALLGVVVFECGGLWFLGSISTGEIKLVMLALAAAGAALWGALVSLRQLRGAFALFAPHPLDLLGVSLTQAEAPGLFALVGELAREQEAILPQNVVAGALSGFFVTSHPQDLHAAGKVLSGRTLHVSLPHLAVLSRAETRVVLAHELAHFAGEDTAFSMHFQPVYAGLAHGVDAVAGRPRGRFPLVDRLLRPAAALGHYVLDRFDFAVKHWSRLRELEADRAALANEAPEALASALLRTAIASEILGVQLEAMSEHPAQAPADLIAQTLLIAEQQGFIEPGRHLDERQPHPTDTHPPTVQRIEAAGVAVDDTLLARAARPVDPAELAAAEALFADWPGLCAAVTAQLNDIAMARDASYLEEVQEAAASVGEARMEIQERRLPAMVKLGAAAFGCLALCGGAILLLARPAPGEGFDPLLLGAAIVLALCGVAACYGLFRFSGERGPFLVLEADGFSSPGLVGGVPWSAVRHLQVVGGRAVTAVISLAPDYALPARTGLFWRVRTRRRRHSVVFSNLRPQGLNARAYFDLLARYQRAAIARAELARRAAVVGEGGGA